MERHCLLNKPFECSSQQLHKHMHHTLGICCSLGPMPKRLWEKGPVREEGCGHGLAVVRMLVEREQPQAQNAESRSH